MPEIDEQLAWFLFFCFFFVVALFCLINERAARKKQVEQAKKLREARRIAQEDLRKQTEKCDEQGCSDS